MQTIDNKSCVIKHCALNSCVLGEDVYFTLAGVVAGDEQASELQVESKTAGAEALGAVAFLLRVPEEVLVAVAAIGGGNGLVVVAVDREGDSHNLVASGNVTVPGAVE